MKWHLCSQLMALTSCKVSSDHKRACCVSKGREEVREHWAALPTTASFRFLAVDSPPQIYTPDVIKTASISLFTPFMASLDLFIQPICPCNSFIHSSLFLPSPPLHTEARNIPPPLPFLFLYNSVFSITFLRCYLSQEASLCTPQNCLIGPFSGL